MNTTGEMTPRDCRRARTAWTFSIGVALALLGALSLTGRLHAADGDLDFSFGMDGKVITDIPGFSNLVTAVAVDAHGRLVVAGYLLAEYEGPYLALARYDSDGTLDTTFGTDGIVHGDAGADGLALDRHGNIVVIGMQMDQSYSTLSRYRADGTLDPSFGAGGRKVTACGGWPSVGIDAANRIVVAGAILSANTPVFCVARYHADGSPDLTFGTAGVTTTPLGGFAVPRTMAIRGDGTIVVGGYVVGADSHARAALAVYTDNGTLDSGFGDVGTVIETFTTSTGFSDVAFDGEGRIVATASLMADHHEFFTTRYSRSGMRDADFNGTGQVIVDFDGDYFAHAMALTLDANGRIVVVGMIGDDVGSDAIVARLNPDGSLDTSFGADGKSRTDFAGLDYVAAVAVDAVGRIVLGGSAGHGGRFDFDFALARYEASTIGYEFSGFFAPVDNWPARNVVKAGRAVPVKFSLNGYQGMDILAAGSPTSLQITCDAGARLDVLDETVTAVDSRLTYDAATDQYTYVWKTEKNWANSCRRLVVTLTDGTSHFADFQLSN